MWAHCYACQCIPPKIASFRRAKKVFPHPTGFQWFSQHYRHRYRIEFLEKVVDLFVSWKRDFNLLGIHFPLLQIEFSGLRENFSCICGWLNRWTLQTRSINLFLCESHFHHCVYVIQPWNHTVCHFVAVRTATMLLFRLETFTTSLFKILYWLPVSNRKATIDLTMIKHRLTKSEMRKLDCFAFCINWRALSPDESLHQRHTF